MEVYNHIVVIQTKVIFIIGVDFFSLFFYIFIYFIYIFIWAVCNCWKLYAFLVGLKQWVSLKLSLHTWCIYTSQTSIYRKNCKLYLGHCQKVMNEVSGGVTPIPFPWVQLAPLEVFASWFQNMQGFLASISRLIVFAGILKCWIGNIWNIVGSSALFSRRYKVLHVINRDRKYCLLMYEHVRISSPTNF